MIPRNLSKLKTLHTCSVRKWPNDGATNGGLFEKDGCRKFIAGSKDKKVASSKSLFKMLDPKKKMLKMKH